MQGETVPSNQYRDWVYRVWGLLEQLTGRKPIYQDACHIGSYCPRCGAGLICLRFLKRPGPGFALDGGQCTLGCTEDQVAEVLFS